MNYIKIKLKADQDRLKYSYLTHLKVHNNTKNPDGTLVRAFADKWFAYSKKGNFLTKNNRERWFNGLKANSLSEVNRDCLLNMHFISKDALWSIKKKSNTNLIKDHIVPIKVIHKILQTDTKRTEEDIELLLKKYYRIGVITKNEDQMLNSFQLKSKMPDDWDGDDIYARYKRANIL